MVSIIDDDDHLVICGIETRESVGGRAYVLCVSFSLVDSSAGAHCCCSEEEEEESTTLILEMAPPPNPLDSLSFFGLLVCWFGFDASMKGRSVLWLSLANGFTLSFCYFAKKDMVFSLSLSLY